jgi:hypothetical protein
VIPYDGGGQEGADLERFRYDRSSKWLIEAHGDAILRIGGIRDIRAWRPRAPEVVQPRQMPDGLLDVQRAGDSGFFPYIVEIETYPKNDTPGKLLDDIVLVWQSRGIVPDVIVLVLHPSGNVEIGGSHEVESRSRLTRMRGSWHIVKLWELPASELLATNDPGVMPWVPLARIDGSPEPVLEECRRVIEEQARPEERGNLLAVSHILGGLRHDVATLRAIFGGREKMIESPVLQELIAETTAETTHKNILTFLRAKHGSVPTDIAAGVRRISDERRLEQLVELAARCPDLDAFRRELGS